MNFLLVMKNSHDFLKDSFDDVVEDAVKIVCLYLVKQFHDYFAVNIDSSFKMPINIAIYYSVDRFAEYSSDQVMSKLQNSTLNISYRFKNFLSTKQHSSKTEQNSYHPYGAYKISNLLENFVEDAFKFLTVQAVLSENLSQETFLFSVINTYVYANEFGDYIGDQVELSMNCLINSSSAYLDNVLNNTQQIEVY
jgi:hypothetical protein